VCSSAPPVRLPTYAARWGLRPLIVLQWPPRAQLRPASTRARARLQRGRPASFSPLRSSFKKGGFLISRLCLEQSKKTKKMKKNIICATLNMVFDTSSEKSSGFCFFWLTNQSTGTLPGRRQKSKDGGTGKGGGGMWGRRHADAPAAYMQCARPGGNERARLRRADAPGLSRYRGPDCADAGREAGAGARVPRCPRTGSARACERRRHAAAPCKSRCVSQA
jgi:hypothetical protein